MFPSLHCAIARRAVGNPQLPRIRNTTMTAPGFSQRLLSTPSNSTGKHLAGAGGCMGAGADVGEPGRYSRWRARVPTLSASSSTSYRYSVRTGVRAVPNRSLPQRLMHNIGVALGGRFLPEIVMHKQDWFISTTAYAVSLMP